MADKKKPITIFSELKIASNRKDVEFSVSVKGEWGYLIDNVADIDQEALGPVIGSILEKLGASFQSWQKEARSRKRDREYESPTTVSIDTNRKVRPIKPPKGEN